MTHCPRTSAFAPRLVALSLLCITPYLTSCGAKTDKDPAGTDTSSHWLSPCERDADCEAGFECLCGACTTSCKSTSQCSDLDANASCGIVDGCSVPKQCLLTCTKDRDCNSDTLECSNGSCTAKLSSSEPDTSDDDTSDDDTSDDDDVDACDFVTERHEAPRCTSSDESCEQSKNEEIERAYYVSLDEYATDENGDDVAYTDAELEARFDCWTAWLEELGGVLLESSSSNFNWAYVRGRWSDLQPALESVVLNDYSPTCYDDDCAYCETFDETDCQADAFCVAGQGRRLDEERDCFEEESFAACAPSGSGCDDAETRAVDGAGQCWYFSSICYYPGFDYTSCGPTDEFPLCADLMPDD